MKDKITKMVNKCFKKSRAYLNDVGDGPEFLPLLIDTFYELWIASTPTEGEIIEILEKHEGERGYGIDFEPAAIEILKLFEKMEIGEFSMKSIPAAGGKILKGEGR